MPHVQAQYGYVENGNPLNDGTVPLDRYPKENPLKG
jgi:hypothetical protein